VRSEIPLEAGLGSSAAAIVAGLIAADHGMSSALGRDELLQHAVALEGTLTTGRLLYGGFVICAGDHVTVIERPLV
jgi:homoserine kinase